MFPPVDDAVLQNNPDFAILYSKLTKSIVDPDGSTKEDPAAKQRKEVHVELDTHRLKAAKQHLLTRAIATTSPPEQSKRLSRGSSRQQQQRRRQSTLPEPLLDLLLILPLLLDPVDSLPQDSIDLLLNSPPLSNLEHLLPELGTLISSTLRSSALDLVRITNPSTNPSYLHRHIPFLSQALSTLISAEASATQSLTTARLRTLTTLTSLLSSYTTATTHLLRSLESKHGVVARSLELQATSITLQAQRSETEVESALWTLRKEMYSPEAIAALQSYASHLKDAKTRAEERLKGLIAELEEYGVGIEGKEGKAKAIQEMARVYREMGKQMEDTKEDLDRLRKGNR